MKKRLSAALAIALAAGALLGAGSASATPTMFGSNCAANQVTEEPGAVWVSTAHPAGAFPATAPTSGVITEWLVNSDLEIKSEGNLAGEFPRLYQQRLLVLRSEGESFKVVGEAPGGPLNLKGASTYLTRLPVQQGDYLGIAGNPFTLFCNTANAADTFDWTVGGTPPGSSFKFKTSAGLQVPITARIEPDVDGDGFGDETQDLCPQSAAYQTACPVVTISSLALTHPKTVTVYVASSLSAPVTVSGTANLGKGKTATLGAPGETVASGALGSFNLVLTKPVRQTLKALSTKKALTLTVSASATNVIGSPSTATSTVKLRGQKKPVHRKGTQHKKARHQHAHHKKPKQK